MPTEPASLTRTRSSMHRLTWLIAEEALLFATLGVIHSGRIIVEPQLLLSALTTGLFMLRQYCSRRSGIFWGACRPERNQNPCRRIENPWAAAGRLSAGDIRRSPYCRSIFSPGFFQSSQHSCGSTSSPFSWRRWSITGLESLAFLPGKPQGSRALRAKRVAWRICRVFLLPH